MKSSAIGLRHFVLGMLLRQSLSGYDINRFLKSLGWLIGTPSFGSLYPVLHDLLDEGLVSMEIRPSIGKPARKIYSITKDGREALHDWLAQPMAQNAPLKAFVMRLLVEGGLPSTDLAAHLQQRRDQLTSQYPGLEQLAADAQEVIDPGLRLTLDYGLALARAELAWLDEAMTFLADKARAPIAQCRSLTGPAQAGTRGKGAGTLGIAQEF